jgi:hypothetical protein
LRLIETESEDKINRHDVDCVRGGGGLSVRDLRQAINLSEVWRALGVSHQRSLIHVRPRKWNSCKIADTVDGVMREECHGHSFRSL